MQFENYNYILVYPLSPYLEAKLQRVQKSVASFGNNRYAKMADIVVLGWLPVKEKTEMNLLRTTHRALCNTFLDQLFNPAKTPNYYEPTLVCYTKTGYGFCRNFSRFSLQVISLFAK